MLNVPSFTQGYARNKSQSAFPQLWDRLLGAWAPFLGPSGDGLYDVSGFGNLGVLTNMDPETDWVVSSNPRLPGYTLDFDGVNDHVIIDENSIFDFKAAGNYTWIFWLNPSSLNAWDCFWTQYIAAASEITFYINNGATEIEVAIFTAPGYGDQEKRQGSSGGLISTGNDFHFVVTYTGTNAAGSKLDIYVNAKLENGTPTASGTLTDMAITNIWLGETGLYAGEDFQGSIQEVRFYDRVLPVTEIALDYQYPGAPWWLKRRQRKTGEEDVVPPVGRVMSSLVGAGGLAGRGGIAGPGGGLAA